MSWYSSVSELDLYPKVFLRVLAGELVVRLRVPTSIYSLKRQSCLVKMTKYLIKGPESRYRPTTSWRSRLRMCLPPLRSVAPPYSACKLVCVLVGRDGQEHTDHER